MTSTPDPALPPVVTAAQACRTRHEHVDRARAKGGRLTSRAALMLLGATTGRIDLYYELVAPGYVTDDTDPNEIAQATLETVASMAEIAADDEGGPNDWGRTTVDDLLAWDIVNAQLPSRPDGQTDSTYTGWGATRHGWAIAAAGVSPTDLYRHGSPIQYEELALMAALRDIRLPALAPGEVFEPPTGIYLEPVQEPFRFGGGGWWRKDRRLVGDTPPNRPRP